MNVHPRNWWPITRFITFLRTRWSLIDVSETSATWANRYNGFAVLNDYDDRKGYQLFICADPSKQKTASAKGIRHLPTALAAIYTYTETETLPEVDDEELQVEITEPALGEVDEDELDTMDFDLQEVRSSEHLLEIFPENEDEIEQVTEVMGDSEAGNGHGGHGGGGSGGSGDDGSDKPKPKPLA